MLIDNENFVLLLLYFFRRFQGCQLQWRKKQLRLRLLLILWESLRAQAQPDWRKLRVFRQSSLKYIWVSFYMSCFLLNFKPVSTELLVILINVVWPTFLFMFRYQLHWNLGYSIIAGSHIWRFSFEPKEVPLNSMAKLSNEALIYIIYFVIIYHSAQSVEIILM